MDDVVFMVHGVQVHDVVADIQFSQALYFSVHLLVNLWVMYFVGFDGEEFSFIIRLFGFPEVHDSLPTTAQGFHMFV